MITIIANTVKPNLARVVRSVVVNSSVWLLLTAVFGERIVLVLVVLCPSCNCSLACGSDVLLRIRCQSSHVVPGEPLRLQVSLENDTGETQQRSSSTRGYLAFEIADSNGRFHQETGGVQHGKIADGPPGRISPHGCYQWDEVVWAAKLIKPVRPLFPTPGKYQLRALLAYRSAPMLSNVLTIDVREPTPAEARAVECLTDVRINSQLFKLPPIERKRLEEVWRSLEASTLRDNIATIVASSYLPVELEREWNAPDWPDRAFRAYAWFGEVRTNPELEARALLKQFAIQEPTGALRELQGNYLVWLDIYQRYDHAYAGFHDERIKDQLDRMVGPGVLTYLYGIPRANQILYEPPFDDSPVILTEP